MTARQLQAVTRIRLGEGRTASALLTMMVVGMTGAAVGANGVESLSVAVAQPAGAARPRTRPASARRSLHRRG
jgi:hypothetical protein